MSAKKAPSSDPVPWLLPWPLRPFELASFGCYGDDVTKYDIQMMRTLWPPRRFLASVLVLHLLPVTALLVAALGLHEPFRVFLLAGAPHWMHVAAAAILWAAFPCALFTIWELSLAIELRTRFRGRVLEELRHAGLDGERIFNLVRYPLACSYPWLVSAALLGFPVGMVVLVNVHQIYGDLELIAGFIYFFSRSCGLGMEFHTR